MYSINVAIIQFPGSNTERETRLALERVGMRAHDIMWNSPAPNFEWMDAYIIVSGFSYADHIRPGLIAAKSAMMQRLAEQAEHGKAILGIGNGAHILIESGLVPGLNNFQIGMAINDSCTHDAFAQNRTDNWRFVKTNRNEKNSVFGQYLTLPMHLPLTRAHARFVIPQSVYAALQQTSASLWYYCDQHGVISDPNRSNPSISADHLAAVSNATGNVLAILSHPERSIDGDGVFASMRNYIQNETRLNYQALSLSLPEVCTPPYQKVSGTHELLTQSPDNIHEALSLQRLLQAQGFSVQVQQFHHWETRNDNPAGSQLSQHIASLGMSPAQLEPLPNSILWLVQKRNESTQSSIRRGKVWCITASHDIATLIEYLGKENILFNPIAETCHRYLDHTR